MPAQRQLEMCARTATKLSVRLAGFFDVLEVAAVAAVGAVLAAHRVGQLQRLERADHLQLLVAHRVGVEAATGGSIAVRQSSCIMWFCTMSRMAPDLS